jgi:hypothetical protein
MVAAWIKPTVSKPADSVVRAPLCPAAGILATNKNSETQAKAVRANIVFLEVREDMGSSLADGPQTGVGLT